MKVAGELATFASSLTEEYTSATRINVVGENVTLNDADLASIANFTSIKTLDLSKVKVENEESYQKIVVPTVNYVTSKINLIVPAAEDSKNEDGSIKYTDQPAYLKELGTKIASSNGPILTVIEFYENEAGNKTCHAFVKGADGWDIDDIVKGADNLDIVSDDGNLGNSIGTLLKSLNNVQVTRLVLLNVPNYGGPFDFTPFTNPNVHCLVLPYNAKNEITKPIKLGEEATAKVFQCLKNEQVWVDGIQCYRDYYYIYCAEPGALAKVENNHYYQNNLSNAWSVRYYGNVNEEDFKYFGKVKNNRFNMSNLEHKNADGTIINLTNAVATINNPYIEYLALPDGVREPADPNFSNLFGESACRNLKAVGYYAEIPTGEGSDATTKNMIGIASNQRGGIYEVLDMLGSSRTQKTMKYQLSGLVYAKDLAVSTSTIYVDEHGHRNIKPMNNEYGQYEGDTKGTAVTGLINVTKATEFDYSNLRLWDKGENLSAEEKAAAQNDLCFTAMGYSKTMSSVKLPTDESVYRLPSSCFPQQHNITRLCIPSNYTEIGSAAFINSPDLELIYTTEIKGGVKGYLVGGKFQTEEPTAENTPEHTCQLPTNLTRIEKHAFGNCELFTDVYVATNQKGEVPYCEPNSFSSGTLQGWGGFNGKHPITRANYQNAKTKQFGILHFPSGLPKAKAELFTDINRDYSLADEKGTTDGNGNVLIWPTKVEWDRAYNQANSGYTWFDWNLFNENGTFYGGLGEKITTREDLIKDGELTDDAKNYGLKAIAGDAAKYNTFAPRNPNYTEGGSESILEQHNTWIGWHQFVLTAAYDYVNPDENKWHAYTTDDNWWTTCLPFDMTKQEVIKTWGEGTKLCTLVGVKRDKTNNTITLQFGKDLVAEASSDDATVLHFRRPYMIKPGQMEKLKDENGEFTGPVFILSDAQNKTLKEASDMIQTEIGKHPRPTDTEEGGQCCVTVTANDENGQEIEGYKYTFLGSYLKYYVPTYSYFLGWDNTKNNVNFFYQTEKPTIMNWNPYTCTIGHYSPDEVTWTQVEGATSRWSFSCDTSDTDNRSSNKDNMPGTTSQPAGAKGMNLYFGADNTTTSIDAISSEGGIKTIPVADVYNLNGQIVRHAGTLQGLTKGVYIIGGKKYIVK